jgi:hypothetical protein
MFWGALLRGLQQTGKRRNTRASSKKVSAP